MKDYSKMSLEARVDLIRETIQRTQDLDGLGSRLQKIIEDWMCIFRIYDFVQQNDLEAVNKLVDSLESGRVETFLRMVGVTEWPAIPAEIYVEVEQEWNEFYAQLNAIRQDVITSNMQLFQSYIYRHHYRWSDHRMIARVDEFHSQINELILREDARLRENVIERSIFAIIGEESRLIEDLRQQAIAQYMDDLQETINRRDNLFMTRRELFASSREDFFVNLKQYPHYQQELWWHMIRIIDNDVIRQDELTDTMELDDLYTFGTRDEQVRGAYHNAYNWFTSLRDGIFKKIAQLSDVQREWFASQETLFWRMIQLIDEDFIQNYAKNILQLERLYSNESRIAQLSEAYHNAYLQFTSYNDEYHNFVAFVSNNLAHRMTDAESDAIVRYLHSFAAEYFLESGEVAEANIEGFRLGLWNLGLRLFDERILRDYIETLRFEAIQRSNDEFRDVVASLTDDRQACFWDRVRFEENQLRHQDATRNINDLFSYYMNEDSFTADYQSLLPQVLNAMRDDTDEFTSALLNYNQAYNNFLLSLNNLGAEELQNYRNETFNAHMIEMIMSRDVAAPTVEFFSDYLFYVYGGRFFDMANNEQLTDREQANVTYQNFLNHFIGEGDANEYEIFWNSLNQLETIAEVHQAIQQGMIIAHASSTEGSALNTLIVGAVTSTIVWSASSSDQIE